MISLTNWISAALLDPRTIVDGVPGVPTWARVQVGGGGVRQDPCGIVHPRRVGQRGRGPGSGRRGKGKASGRWGEGREWCVGNHQRGRDGTCRRRKLVEVWKWGPGRSPVRWAEGTAGRSGHWLGRRRPGVRQWPGRPRGSGGVTGRRTKPRGRTEEPGDSACRMSIRLPLAGSKLHDQAEWRSSLGFEITLSLNQWGSLRFCEFSLDLRDSLI